MSIKITYSDNHKKFLAKADLKSHTSDLVKFGWIKMSDNILYTDDLYAVEKFKSAIHDDITKSMVAERLNTWKKTLRDSYRKIPKTSVKLNIPNGKTYKDYQKHGIVHSIRQFENGLRGVLIADEMGLGKTIQAIGVINNMPNLNSTLIVCPASLKLMWFDALNDWMTKFFFTGIAASKDGFPDTEIVIINYDILMRFRREIMQRQWDLTILDESHNVKNPKAQRTKAILGGGGFKTVNSKNILFLTGTPVLNRPVELWTTLKTCDPASWNNFAWYTRRYCQAFTASYGRDVRGASNTKELQRRARSTIMIRRLKKDVLKELPPKIHQVVKLTADNKIMNQLRKEKSALAKVGEKIAAAKFESNIRSMNQAVMIAFTELAKVRAETALLKIKPGLEVLKDTVESSGKVIVFAHHKAVISELEDKCPYEYVTITGSTPKDKRHVNVHHFQTDENVRVFLANMSAAGVGLTLTAASHVIFLELGWSPALMSQCVDRAHRMGQDDTVFAKYLVFDDSIDAKMANILIDKQKVISSTVGEGESNEDTLNELLRA